MHDHGGSTMEDANGLALYAELLGLEEFEVVQHEREAGGKAWHFTIVPRIAVGLCPQCGRISEERHACHERRFWTCPSVGA